MVRIVLPHHLRELARTGKEVEVEVVEPVTVSSILDGLEAAYPMLKGTVRDHGAQVRRPLVRFFACGEDISMEPMDFVLPPSIGQGAAPFMIIGSIAGG